MRWISLLLLLMTAVSAHAQDWVRVPPQTSYTYYGCWFDPSNPDRGSVTGWYNLAYDQVPFVYATANGGQTLTYQNIYAQSGYMMRTSQTIFYTSSNTGYVAGTEIMKTVDGGANWSICLDFGYIQGKLSELYFASPDSGYVVGEGWYGPTAMFFKTYNAGVSWVQSDPPLDESTWLTCLARPTAHALYAGAGDTWGRTLFKSTDDGNTWTALSTTMNIFSLSFSSASTGCAGTSTGIYRTTNGGATWAPVQATTGTVNCVRIKNNFGFAVTSNGRIYKTTNDGASWSEMSSPVLGVDLEHISLLSSTHAYAVGASGTILRYNTATGIGDLTNLPGPFFLQNTPNPCGTYTTITYNLPTAAEVSLRLFDARGRLLRVLARGPEETGTHRVELDASGLAAGTYFYRLDGVEPAATRKLVVR